MRIVTDSMISIPKRGKNPAGVRIAAAGAQRPKMKRSAISEARFNTALYTIAGDMDFQRVVARQMPSAFDQA